MIYLESHYLQTFKKEIDELKIIIEKKDKQKFRDTLKSPIKIDALMKMSTFELNSFNFIIIELCKEIIYLAGVVEYEFSEGREFRDYFDRLEEKGEIKCHN